MTRLRILAAIPVLALVACGNSTPTTAPSTTASTPAGGAVNVEVKEYAISATPATLAAGSITFNVKNSGKITHEFVVLQSDLAPDQLPAKDHEVEEDKLTSPGELEDIAAGSTASKTFTLAAGKYVLICNIATHYENGMRAAFTVA
jgi:uncharacterized cupredoxin-like copper-binding protein